MTDDLHLEMDSYQPLRNVVFQTLRTAILKGELRPGERLMELQLAAKLGVSRTPIREAIRMLEQEGLAKTIARKGAHVAKMTEKDMEDVLEIRLALEDLAVRSACKKMTDEALKKLREAMEAFEQATKSEDIMASAEADVQFHDVIYEAADNPKLLTLVNNLREQMYRYRMEYLKDVSGFAKLREEHKEMYEAFQSRDEETAVKYLQRHLLNQTEAVKQIILEQG